MEWDIVPDKGVDHVIVYAQTPDHNANTYQSSKALLSGLGSSAEVWRIVVGMYPNLELRTRFMGATAGRR